MVFNGAVEWLDLLISNRRVVESKPAAVPVTSTHIASSSSTRPVYQLQAAPSPAPAPTPTQAIYHQQAAGF